MTGSPRFAQALGRLRASLDQSQWISADRIAAGQADRLRALVAHHAEATPSFRRRLQDAGLRTGDVSTPAGLRALPPLTRRDVVAAGADLFATHLPAAYEPYGETRTSGSTGEPVVVRRTAADALLWAGLTMRELDWHAVDFSWRFSAVRATLGRLVEQRSWGMPVAAVESTGAGQAIPVSTPIDELAAILDRFRPGVLLVYPTVLGGLLDLWAARGRALDGVAVVQTIGEILDPEVRAATVAALGCRVVDTYSSQELGQIAVDCPSGSGLKHVMAENVVVEVLDDDGAPTAPGQIGRVVVTGLQNLATPLVRYEIGDLAEAGRPCACGRGLPTLGRIVGRRRNLVVQPDGRRHFPLVGFHRFQEVGPIVQYQLVQHAVDDVEVRLVVHRPMTSGEEGALTEVIQGALGHPFPLRFTYVEGALPRGPGGKFEEFVTLVP